MTRPAIIGVVLVVAGAVLASFSNLETALGIRARRGAATPPETAQKITLVPVGSDSSRDANPSASFPALPTIPTDRTLADCLMERAQLEIEAAAQRAAMAFMQALTATVREDNRSFAEELYSVGANARAIYKSDEDYRAFVAHRFYEELSRRTDLQDNLNAAVFEYLNRLERVGQQVAIESGLNVEVLPPVALTVNEFQGRLRQEIGEAVANTSDTMQEKSREGASLLTATTVASIGLGMLIPIPVIDDLIIFAVVDGVIGLFRDPVGDVAIAANQSAEQLAERICFGTDQRSGFYAALLDVGQGYNRRLRAVLELAAAEPDEADPAAVAELANMFGESHD